jgi:hypothetical protein
MTVLADFQTIIGDGGQEVSRNINYPQTPAQQLGVLFEAGGHIEGQGETGGRNAFLMFSVTGVLQNAEVFVNGEGPVGFISRSPAVQNEWSTQLIAISGERLQNAGNSITVRVVNDAFFIKDLICFYHQDSD